MKESNCGCLGHDNAAAVVVMYAKDKAGLVDVHKRPGAVEDRPMDK